MKTLFVIGTPIGNLEDITVRALKTLKAVSFVICENPLLTKKLLDRWNIKDKRLFRYNEANKKRVIPKILRLLEKENLALVSDAGTPLISDPGAELVKAVLENGGKAVAVPGPSALTSSLSISGVRLEKFLFMGFLPRKSGQLKKTFEWLKKEKLTAVTFEAPHRIEKTLRLLEEYFPDVEVLILKELTKIHETVLRGSPSDILLWFKDDPKSLKGEFVMILKWNESD